MCVCMDRCADVCAQHVSMQNLGTQPAATIMSTAIAKDVINMLCGSARPSTASTRISYLSHNGLLTPGPPTIAVSDSLYPVPHLSCLHGRCVPQWCCMLQAS